MQTEPKKISLPLSKIANGQFVPALNLLMNLPLPNSRDTYALARTLDLLEPELKAHAKALNTLLAKHGAQSNVAEIRLKIEAIVKAIPKLEGKEKDDADKTLAALKAEERKVLMTVGEQMQLTTDCPTWDEFVAERAKLEATPVELFLDHKVKLPETNLPLTAIQIRELIELVEC